MYTAVERLSAKRGRLRHSLAPVDCTASVVFQPSDANPLGLGAVGEDRFKQSPGDLPSWPRFALVHSSADCYLTSGNAEAEPIEPTTGNVPIKANVPTLVELGEGTEPFLRLKGGNVALEWIG